MSSSESIQSDYGSSGIRPLLLVGGESTRMGYPKHLLKMPDGRPLYHHLLDVLCVACSDASAVYISLAKDSMRDSFMRNTHKVISTTARGGHAHRLELLYDAEADDTDEPAGPACGMLAAFDAYPEATWLVLACDYPLMTAGALRQLQAAYKPPVTCFRNLEGFCEPLVGIWGPEALQRLKENNANGRSGPSSVVRELGEPILMPDPSEGQLLMNVNTDKEWQAALEKLKALDE